LGGTGTLTLTGTGSTWTGGEIIDAGSLVISSGASLTISRTGNRDLKNRSITNSGTVNWTGGDLRAGGGASFTNQSGATFSITGNGYGTSNPFGGSFSFSNSGTIEHGGTGNTDFNGAITNSGNVRINGGGLKFSGSFTQSAGAIRLANNAKVEFVNGLNFSAGTLHGNGTVVANISNGGLISAGDTLGRLDITGNLTLTSGGAILFDIGGTSQGVNYDYIAVSGSATFGGELRIGILNGFESTILSTDVFTVFGSGSAITGAFSNLVSGNRLTTTDGKGSFEVLYGVTGYTNSVVLRNFQVTPIPEPSTYAMLAIGLLGAGIRFLRRRS
jgi:fibronectin-binding autotransporter adhesin